ncbi:MULTISPECIES: bacillithiol system redox-active protein YtxJ [Croceitalea]|uniref:Bacillithiol system redox-active protein YtxJ n=1 Tax=Croceitalea vernalis TaxID=3075599 RepID=A0ABU3BHY1_9FLAO|nr:MULTISPECIES: bacillithiol system redox-active protein YtxJ [unclassified Croceitalea]MDT0539953.1 bacillithiol system redox-active protein YtxJ [Croceitalea sp. P059]MDT0621773.1 bacillithiol system redox-active protein YtxJ [Croceitalea sp. P007]
MGIFNDLFGKSSEMKKEKKSLPWIPLNSVEQLKEIEQKSATKTQVIFKHSTSCGISRMVLNMFTDKYDIASNQMDIYFLDLLANRDVSNETGIHFQVLHQSPQLLIIKNGVTVFHTSHGAISEVQLEQYI